MKRYYLRSDMSGAEARFYTRGIAIIGEGNVLTSLFKIIGKHAELRAAKKEQLLYSYNPDEDFRFLYENKGYCVIRNQLKDNNAPGLSRRFIKNLSRVWPLSHMVISFNCKQIYDEVFTYINSNPTLHAVCARYLQEKSIYWQELMPIQADFLITRHIDQHKDYQIAARIINELAKTDYRE